MSITANHTPIPITRAEWRAIPRDYKGTDEHGVKSCFACFIPKGMTTHTGTTLVAVVIVPNPKV